MPLIIPAGWTFAVWGPIFLLCAVYTVYQALPSERYNPLLRRIGWPLGLAFVRNGLWTTVQPLQNPILSQVIVTLILASSLVALIRFARFGKTSRGVRWIVGLPVGLLASWLTAANVVGFNDMLVRREVVGSGFPAALTGASLLIVRTVVAAAVLGAIAGGSLQATATYTLGVSWGLFGIVANQYDTSLITSGGALLCLVALVARLVWAVGKTRPGSSGSIGNSGSARVA